MLVGCGQSVLYKDLPEREANEIMAILDNFDIPCGKQAGSEDKRWTVTVAKDRFAEAVGILSDLGRPREEFPSLAEMFPKSGFVSSPSEQQIRLISARQIELSETISQLPGVIAARVHLDMPLNQGFSDTVRPPSASVVVWHRRDAQLANSTPLIRQIVEGAVPGLSPDDVTVQLVEMDDAVMASRSRRQLREAQERHKTILSVKVSADSANRLVAILAACGGLTFLALGFAAYTTVRRAKAPGDQKSTAK